MSPLEPRAGSCWKEVGRSVSDMFALFEEPQKKVKRNLKTVSKIYL